MASIEFPDVRRPGLARKLVDEGSLTGEPDAYPYHKKRKIEEHVNEAWELLRRDGLIAPSAGINGRNGYSFFDS
jgi:hypothetical protein